MKKSENVGKHGKKPEPRLKGPAFRKEKGHSTGQGGMKPNDGSGCVFFFVKGSCRSGANCPWSHQEKHRKDALQRAKTRGITARVPMKMMFHLWVHFCAAHGNLEHGVFGPALVVVSKGEGLRGCCNPRSDTGVPGGHPFVSNNSNQFFDVLLCFHAVHKPTTLHASDGGDMPQVIWSQHFCSATPGSSGGAPHPCETPMCVMQAPDRPFVASLGRSPSRSTSPESVCQVTSAQHFSVCVARRQQAATHPSQHPFCVMHELDVACRALWPRSSFTFLSLA